MNLKRILAAGAVAGMLAVTGCADNWGGANQGGANGQRVTNAANRGMGAGGQNGRAMNNQAGGTVAGGGAVGGGGMANGTNRSIFRPQGRIGHTFRNNNGRAMGLNNGAGGFDNGANGGLNGGGAIGNRRTLGNGNTLVNRGIIGWPETFTVVRGEAVNRGA